MTGTLARRQLGLACVALLATAAVLAIAANTRSAPRPGPEAVGSYVAPAGSSGPTALGRRTSCGGVIGEETLGVASPTLPCGTRIYLTYRGTRVLTTVIDRRAAAGREFDLTDALARLLDLSGVRTVSWSYAA